MADIFVSYTSNDRDWAFWIGQELEKLGHAPRIHEWEISAGGEPGGGKVPRRAGSRTGTPRALSVPLHYEGMSIGAVTVTSARPDAFGRAEAAALRQLGAQVEVAALRLHMTGELRRIDADRETGEALFRRLFYDNPQPMWVIDVETERFLLVNAIKIAPFNDCQER